MPEGDTVFLAATRMRAALAGHVLTRGELRVPRFATAALAGRTVDDIVSRGKHMLIRLAGGVTLHTHYRMEGSWHLYRHGERWRGPDFQVRALLETADWVAVGFRLAVTELLPTASEGDVVGHLGPDPLGPDWDAAEALRRLVADPERPIGETLLDQRVIAGPGNVYKCELCFLRGIDPWTPVGRVREPERLVALIKRVFDANRTTGSQVTTGDLRPGHERWVYLRGGQPCRRCRTRIAVRSADDDERVTYWCPRCQPPVT
ncbi:MAG TPA: DNA-formamidopyrimidine glycosylase family protein [Candidatus Binatia bacterium]|nr:DNA-formamidopyrimidine glycosylase family protein [Candidatus Binatia bacterium]